MKTWLIALGLLAGCSPADQPAGDRGAPAARIANEASSSSAGPSQSPDPRGRLTGLYEGGSAGRPDQLCIVDTEAGDSQFGLVVWGANMHSCSGSGRAVREGELLRLEMAGDVTCTIEARIAGGVVTLPQTVSEGCSYYCAARARLTHASFARTGNSIAAALRAKDLAGDALCSTSRKG